MQKATSLQRQLSEATAEAQRLLHVEAEPRQRIAALEAQPSAAQAHASAAEGAAAAAQAELRVVTEDMQRQRLAAERQIAAAEAAECRANEALAEVQDRLGSDIVTTRQEAAANARRASMTVRGDGRPRTRRHGEDCGGSGGAGV